MKNLHLLRRFSLGLWILAAAHLPAQSVTLSWNSSGGSATKGYRLYYGTVTSPLSNFVDTGLKTTGTVTGLTNGVTYTFAVTSYNSAGANSEFSKSVSATIGATKNIPPSVLTNISSRTQVLTGENVMIGGFIVEGVVAKKVAVRALGPSLAAYGVTGAMSDPRLQIVDSKGQTVATNDNWNVAGEQLSANNLAPSDPREAGLVLNLAPGSYSAIVTGSGGSTGVALFDLYDLGQDTGRVANISTRSMVNTGDNVMIGGFILGGTTPSEVVVRAIGPSLAPYGVTNALLDPTLELYDGNGTLVASNDNWRTDQANQIIMTNLAPTDDRESAIVETLSPGAYSGVIRGANNTTGVALFEVYALNQ